MLGAILKWLHVYWISIETIHDHVFMCLNRRALLILFGQDLEQVDLWDGFLVHGLDRRLDPGSAGVCQKIIVPGQVLGKVNTGGSTVNHVVDDLFKLLIIFESFEVVLISQSPPALAGKNCVIDNILDSICDGFC